MKKLHLCLYFSLSLTLAGFSQNAYYHAKLLYSLNVNEIDTLDFYKELLTLQSDKDDWRNVRAFITDPLRYVAEEKPDFNVQVIAKLQNLRQQYRLVSDRGRIQFERKFASSFDFVTTPQGPIEDVAGSLVDVIFGSGLGANLGTGLVNASSSLLLNRAESELTLSFLTRLREEFENRPFFIFSESIRSDQIQIDTFYLRNIFPSSYALISDYDQIVSINFGKSLQNAFEEDLRLFYGNAARYLVPAPLRESIVYQIYNLIHTSFTDLSKGAHPSVILTSLAEQYAVPEVYTMRNAVDTFKCGVQLLEGASRSLRDVSPSRVWIRADEFRKLSIREREYFIALFYLDNRSVLRKLGINGSRFQLGERSSDFVRLQQLIYQNLVFLEQVENKIADLRLINATRIDRTPGLPEVQSTTTINNTEQNRLRAFQEYAFMFSDVVQHISAYACWANRGSFICGSDFQEHYLPVARELLQIPLEVEAKSYSAAFLKTLKVIETLQRNNPFYQRPQGFVRYLTLAADAVAADSAERIRQILNQVILPVGSYRVKRYSSSSIYVAALVGAGGGAEWIDNPSVVNKWATHISPFAPVGIDFSWGSRKLLKNSAYTTRGTSDGIFLSILDLGTVTSYRFQNDGRGDRLTSTNLPSIKLEQLLSPGVFYTHGFRNSPIVWGMGAQLTPRLRDIVDAKNITVDRANAFRFSAFLAVDLPLFNLAVKNDRLPKYNPRIAQRQLDRMMLEREISELNRQMFRSSSPDERRRIENEIKRREKQLKKG